MNNDTEHVLDIGSNAEVDMWLLDNYPVTEWREVSKPDAGDKPAGRTEPLVQKKERSFTP